MTNITSRLIFSISFTAFLFLGIGIHAQSDHLNARLLDAKARLSRGQLSMALGTAKSALIQAESLNDPQLVWETKNLIGEIYLTQKDYKKAIDLFIGITLKAEKSNNFSVSANGYLSLANIYSSMGAYYKAKNTFIKAYDQFEKIDYEMGMIEVLSSAGYNNLKSGDLESALEDFTSLLTSANNDSIPYFKLIAHDGLLDTYHRLDEYEKGKEIATNYLALIEKEGGSDHMAITAHNKLALLYFNQEEYQACLSELRISENIQISAKTYNQGLEETLNAFISVFKMLDETENSRIYQEKLEQLQSSLPPYSKLSEEEITNAETLADEFEKTSRALFNDAEREINLFESEQRKDNRLNDKIRLDNIEHETLIGARTFRHSALEAEYIHQDLMVAHHKYESTERQFEILMYKEQLELHKLQLTVIEEEKVILEQKAQIHKKQQLLYLIIGVATLLIIVVFGIEYFRVRKLSKLLSEQQQIIHQRNVELEMSNATIMAKNAKLHKAHDEIKNKNEALKNSQANLVQAEKLSALGLLTAGIAHEINNPIGFVSNGLQVIEENVNEMIQNLLAYDEAILTNDLEKIKSLYQEIQENGQDTKSLKEELNEIIRDATFGTVRIIEIVDGLRVFSRKDEKNFSKAYLPEIMESALLISKSKYKGRVEIKREFAENIPQIDCYPGQLNQVFINLIGNAADAISDTGSIKIAIQSLDSKHVRIIIQDDGSGMSEEIRSKIFEPLFTTKESGKGTGLGLSITTEIIKTHKAQIEVRSKVGVGTAFIITMLVNIDQ